jgi:hypothetical protein
MAANLLVRLIRKRERRKSGKHRAATVTVKMAPIRSFIIAGAQQRSVCLQRCLLLRESLPNHIQRVLRQLQRRQFFLRKPPHFRRVAGGGEISRNPAA